MADHPVTDLSYGHLGQSIYDRENRCWRFSRKPGRRHTLQPLGACETIISAPKEFDDPRASTEYSIQQLGRQYPEIVPGASLLPPLATVSDAVTRTSLTYDPAISCRIAVGEARDVENQSSGRRTFPVLAIAGGTAGESVRLLPLQERRLNWEDDRSQGSVRLSVVDFTSREEGWWSGDGAPVRQVCFAQSLGSGASWLAIRQITSTTILRPLYHRLPFSSPTTKYGKRHPPSRVNPNAIVKLSIDRTGGSPHADVAFNPWYHRQFGVVDQDGRWSVWNVEGRVSKRNLYKVKLEKSGSIHHVRKPDRAETGRTDGWGALCWAGDVHTLVVCNRREMAIIDLKQVSPLHLQGPDLGLAPASRWILDLKRSTIHDGHVYVVTNSQIFWLEIVRSTESNEQKDEFSRCRILLSWRHSRYQEDISLGLNVFASGQDTLLQLYSRYTDLVTGFHFAMSSQRPHIPLSISDPYRIEFFRELSQGQFQEIPKMSNLLLLPASYFAQAMVERRGLGSMYENHDVRFYTGFVLGNDLSLYSRLYTSGVPTGGWRGRRKNMHEQVKEPVFSSRIVRAGAKSTTRVTDDRFIVEDGEGETEDSEADTKVRGRSSNTLGKDILGPGNQPPMVEVQEKDPWTLDWEWLYYLAFLKENEGRSRLVNEEGEMKTSTGRMLQDDLTNLENKLLAKHIAGFRPIETLLELQGHAFQTFEPSQISSRVKGLMNSLSNDQRATNSASRLAFRSLIPPRFFTKDRDEQTGLSSSITDDRLSVIYGNISQQWIEPLKDNVPEELYEANQRMAKDVAMDVYLASIGVGLRSEAEDQELDGGYQELLQLPLRPTGKQPPSASVESRREKLPLRETQPNHLTDSQLPPSYQWPPASAPPASSKQQHDQEENISSRRLRAYTPIRPQPALPSSLANILAHWTIGADPSNYSWEATTNQQKYHDNTSFAAAAGEGEKPQQQRRRDRTRHDHIGLSQQQPSASQPNPLQSNRLIVGGWNPSSSQPKPVGTLSTETRAVANGSNKATAATAAAEEQDEQDIPMTQIERGVYGGRQGTHGGDANKALKRKRREAGF